MNNLRTDTDILTVKDLKKDYPSLGRDEIYKILRSKGCPLISGRVAGEKYKISRKNFEIFANIR